jgi:hypothetical protein
MRCRRLAEVTPGEVLARPARAADGGMLLKPGTVLDRAALADLERHGLHEAWVVGAGERVPDPTVPEYQDRYGQDFPARLQQVFSSTLADRAMQGLFLAAIAHATDCYRRYRLSDRDEGGG